MGIFDYLDTSHTNEIHADDHFGDHPHPPTTPAIDYTYLFASAANDPVLF